MCNSRTSDGAASETISATPRLFAVPTTSPFAALLVNETQRLLVQSAAQNIVAHMVTGSKFQNGIATCGFPKEVLNGLSAPQKEQAWNLGIQKVKDLLLERLYGYVAETTLAQIQQPVKGRLVAVLARMIDAGFDNKSALPGIDDGEYKFSGSRVPGPSHYNPKIFGILALAVSAFAKPNVNLNDLTNTLLPPDISKFNFFSVGSPATLECRRVEDSTVTEKVSTNFYTSIS